jgi:hypothetical protein
MNNAVVLRVIIVVLSIVGIAKSGPYNEPGIGGYVGPDFKHADPNDPNAVINPIFRGWAGSVASYEPAADVGCDWDDPVLALGPVTGDHTDIVSLGDLEQYQIDEGVPAGRITLVFGDPNEPNDPCHIRDGKGYDFAVFENSFVSQYTDPYYGYTEGEVFAELGYVEVSSNGTDFVRFSSVSLTNEPVGYYGTVDITDLYNLAGKHPNGNAKCTGTGFDLRELANETKVQSGLVDLNNISYVRIVDIPGSGDFFDDSRRHIDPCSWPDWNYYDANYPIYDAWVTYDSSGLDLEAIGVLYPQQYKGDINLDGVVDYGDLSILTGAWLKQFGQDGWVARCDIDDLKDMIVDFVDFAVLAKDWGKVEQWRQQN